MEEVSLAWHMKALNSYCSEDRREKLKRQLSAQNGESYSQVLRADWTVFPGWLFTRPVNKMTQFKSMRNIFPFTYMFIAPIYMLLVSLWQTGRCLLWSGRPRKRAVGFYEAEILRQEHKGVDLKSAVFKTCDWLKSFPLCVVVLDCEFVWGNIKSPQKMSALWNKQGSHWWREEAARGQPSWRFRADKSTVTYWNGSTTARFSYDSRRSQSPPFSQRSGLAVLTENPPLIIIGIQHHNTPPWRGLS